MMLDFALFILLAFFTVCFSYVVFRNTRLDFKPRSGLIWSVWLYKEFFIVLLAPVVLSLFSNDVFHDLKYVDSGRIFNISLFIIISLLIFIMVLSFSIRILPRYRVWEASARADVDRFEMFSVSAVLAGVSLLVFSLLFLNVFHALYESIFSSANIRSIRLDNRYHSNFPSQLGQVVTVASFVAAIYCGFLLYLKRRLSFLLFAILNVFLSSWAGSKAPIVQSFMLIFASYFSFRCPSFGFFKGIFYGVFYFLFIVFLVYGVVKLQYQDMDFVQFILYLVKRLGVSQMAGVYNSMSIDDLSGEFFWHAIPFSSFFIEYPNYQKELMLYVNPVDSNSTGMMNSFFISEAYGMGGWALAIMSPFVVGVSYGVGAFIQYKVMTLLFGGVVANFYALPLYILCFSITGGFSGFALFKGIILNIMVFVLIYLFQILLLSFVAGSARRIMYGNVKIHGGNDVKS